MKQILLVDDDAELLEGLLRHFRPHRQEWQVATAGNGNEALRLARERSFDLLVTDMLMPEKDGIETVVAFRREYPSTKIIAMSGGGRQVGKEPLEYVRLLGAHATLEKPFDFNFLRDMVRSLLEPEPNTQNPSSGGGVS
jgi:CheY-like chemotaxis protein